MTIDNAITTFGWVCRVYAASKVHGAISGILGNAQREGRNLTTTETVDIIGRSVILLASFVGADVTPETFRAIPRFPVTLPTKGEQETTIDLLKLDEIPVELGEDRVLTHHTCPISLAPIRFACHLSGTPQLNYERKCLEKWIKRNGKHPFTGQAVNLEDILDSPKVQDAINLRLEELNTAIKTTIQNT